MKKQWDKLFKIFKINKQMAIFLFGLSLTAIIAGSLYLTILSDADQQLIQESVVSFFNNISNKEFNVSFKQTLLTNIGFIIIIWLLGISVIGVPIILLLFFSKLFTIGFSISSIIYQYKLKGILYALIYIFPHYVINIYLWIILISYAISLSLEIIYAIIKKTTIDFKIVINKYLKVLLIVISLVLFTTIMEIYIMPKLLNLLLMIIK